MAETSSSSPALASSIPSTAAELELALASLSSSHNAPLNSVEFAERMDNENPFSAFRSQFHIPPVSSTNSSPCVYMCGNSLGLQAKSTRMAIDEEMNKWACMGVEGHFHGKRPWANIDEKATRLFMPVVGAHTSDEIAVMNSLSVNLHLLLLTFYRPTKDRYKILIEESAFCSDWHVVRSQVELHGYNPDDAIIALAPSSQSNSLTLDTQDILKTIDAHSSEISVILLGGVQFYTGQLFDMKAITNHAHKYNIITGFDLAHAVGNVPLSLHEWDVDFAAWCTYKYLNAGPGATAGIFVHQRHHQFAERNATLKGWWGQECSNRFSMKRIHETKYGAQSFMLSNPAVLPLVCLESSLEIFEQAGGVSKLRGKSVILTGYLEYLLNAELISKYPGAISIITPRQPCERGSQLSVLLSVSVRPLVNLLTEMGCIVDAREPNVIRLSPAALYNSFQDVYKCIQTLKQAMIQLKIID